MRIQSVQNFVEAAIRENFNLAAIRDTLLPQLMSGKLRVKDAKKQIEAVV
jgi:type I restriction enzyme, S subunit